MTPMEIKYITLLFIQILLFAATPDCWLATVSQPNFLSSDNNKLKRQWLQITYEIAGWQWNVCVQYTVEILTFTSKVMCETFKKYNEIVLIDLPFQKLASSFKKLYIQKIIQS